MPSFTLADLELLTYDRLEGNTTFYLQAEVDRAINEFIRVFNLFTGFLQTTAVVPGGTQANRFFYDVPKSVLFPMAMSFNNRQLNRSSLPVISMRYRNWLTQTTTNFGPVATWIPVGIRTFAIHPADATGGGVLNVTGVQEPTPLVTATDAVSIPDEFVEAGIEMAAYSCQLKEGGKIFADASVLYQKFLSKMKEWSRWDELKHPRYWIEKESVKGA